jgi:hypothetical protein
VREETPPVDYGKVKGSALQALAAGGDGAAIEELGRRGETVRTVDVIEADYITLRTLVQRWRDGRTVDEVARSFDLAQRAQSELRCRRATVANLGGKGCTVRYHGPLDVPGLPPIGEWERPIPPRCRSWKRPTSSTHYRSDEDIAREQMNGLALEHYARLRARERAAGEPRKDV